MLNRASKKVAFDSVSGILLTLGTAGLGFGVYQKEIIPGLFGIASILLAVIVSYLRNSWNEGDKAKFEESIQEIARKEINKITPVVVRTVKPIVKDIKEDIKDDIKNKTDKIVDKLVDNVVDKAEDEIKEKAQDLVKPLFDSKP